MMASRRSRGDGLLQEAVELPLPVGVVDARVVDGEPAERVVPSVNTPPRLSSSSTTSMECGFDTNVTSSCLMPRAYWPGG